MKQFLIISLSFVTFACTDISQKAKHAINKTGETVGKSASEFVDGVSEGVESTIEREIVLSDKLKSSGIEIGKVKIASESESWNNILTVYMIFSADYKGKISAKVFNKKGEEVGRTTNDISGKSGEAKYIDFVFDPRTNIDVKSEITMD